VGKIVSIIALRDNFYPVLFTKYYNDYKINEFCTCSMRGGMRSAYRIVVGAAGTNRLHWRFKPYDIKKGFKECELDSYYSEYFPLAVSYKHDIELCDLIKGG
jgi:hypothetical protein